MQRDAPTYEIRIAGRLGANWGAWFDGLDVDDQLDGTTVLRGPIADQAALHGLLRKVSDLGLVIESLTHLPVGEPDAGPHDLTPTINHPSGATS